MLLPIKYRSFSLQSDKKGPPHSSFVFISGVHHSGKHTERYPLLGCCLISPVFAASCFVAMGFQAMMNPAVLWV